MFFIVYVEFSKASSLSSSSYYHASSIIDSTDEKVALVSMVNGVDNFDLWLDYYLNTLGMDHMFLRIEDAFHFQNLLKKYPPGKITAEFVAKEDIDIRDNYDTKMERQDKVVTNACLLCKEMNIDYLLHIDSDELLHVEAPVKLKIPEYLKHYLAQINKTSDASCFHIRNFEAIFPNSKKHCFSTNKFIDCSKGGCLSYANGKSFANIKHNPRYFGPHYFSGAVYEIPPSQMKILHFDSCSFSQYLKKFKLMQDISEEEFQKIPFSFYKDSIKMLQECNREEEDCDLKLNEYFLQQKIQPFYEKSTVIKIDHHNLKRKNERMNDRIDGSLVSL